MWIFSRAVLAALAALLANPTIKTECKEDGWQSFAFNNQGTASRS
jgi:hypothetical protein